jgi:hypothetical protein
MASVVAISPTSTSTNLRLLDALLHWCEMACTKTAIKRAIDEPQATCGAAASKRQCLSSDNQATSSSDSLIPAAQASTTSNTSLVDCTAVITDEATAAAKTQELLAQLYEWFYRPYLAHGMQVRQGSTTALPNRPQRRHRQTPPIAWIWRGSFFACGLAGFEYWKNTARPRIAPSQHVRAVSMRCKPTRLPWPTRPMVLLPRNIRKTTRNGFGQRELVHSHGSAALLHNGEQDELQTQQYIANHHRLYTRSTRRGRPRTTHFRTLGRSTKRNHNANAIQASSARRKGKPTGIRWVAPARPTTATATATTSSTSSAGNEAIDGSTGSNEPETTIQPEPPTEYYTPWYPAQVSASGGSATITTNQVARAAPQPEPEVFGRSTTTSSATNHSSQSQSAADDASLDDDFFADMIAVAATTTTYRHG